MLPERERMIAFEAADLTIAPSPDDLLAQAVLESMAVGTPVLASARNAAAVAHCRRANGGLYYENREEFVEMLRLIAREPQMRERLGEAGRDALGFAIHVPQYLAQAEWAEGALAALNAITDATGLNLPNDDLVNLARANQQAIAAEVDTNDEARQVVIALEQQYDAFV